MGYYETMPCSSACMRIEEIEQERARSGWNPYEGEEEEYTEEAGWQMPRGKDRQMLPYYARPEFAQVLEEQKKTEQDLRMLQSMYPSAAKTILPYIMEECDRMEYEGSSMFDRYPDQTTVMNIQNRIYDQVKDQFQVEETAAPDEILSMQNHGVRRDPRSKNWLDDLVRVLLIQEMHHRRCRHRGCRRGRF